MRRTSTLVVQITWDDSETDQPGRWDWVNLIDVERGHVEIVADSDDRKHLSTLERMRHGM